MASGDIEMSRRIATLAATAMCVVLTTLTGCSLIWQERGRGCEGDEKTTLVWGADELARRVRGLTLTGYVGCDSGQAAYAHVFRKAQAGSLGVGVHAGS